MIVDLGGGIKVDVKAQRSGRNTLFSITALSPNGVPFQISGKVDLATAQQILGQMRGMVQQKLAQGVYALAQQGQAMQSPNVGAPFNYPLAYPFGQRSGPYRLPGIPTPQRPAVSYAPCPAGQEEKLFTDAAGRVVARACVEPGSLVPMRVYSESPVQMAPNRPPFRYGFAR